MRVFCIFCLFFLITSSAFSSEERKILFIGDSLSEGYGVEKDEAYPMVFERLINEELEIKIKVINGSVSGSTSASGLSRLRWFLKAKPHWVVLALGANDGLRGVELSSTKENLENFILKSKQNNIKVALAGMLLPKNYGEDYREEFEQMFKKLAQKHNVELMPFLLKDVAMVKELNLSDGIHPNKEGHKIMAKNLKDFFLPLLKKN